MITLAILLTVPLIIIQMRRRELLGSKLATKVSKSIETDSHEDEIYYHFHK